MVSQNSHIGCLKEKKLKELGEEKKALRNTGKMGELDL